MPVSESILQEGVIIQPEKYIKKGNINTGVHDFILSSVRTPQERDGDLAAQVMANMTGIAGLHGIMKKNSLTNVEFLCRELIEYSRRITEKTISGIPDGQYVYEDFLDPDVPDDGRGASIHVKLEVAGNRMNADFSKSAPQVGGCLNAVYAITLSCVLYVVRSLSEVDIPANAGCLAPVEVVTKKGTIVDAVFPAAVAGGNVETSQRIVDVLLGALAQAIPKKIPAASQGTMNNVTIGGYDPKKGGEFAYYETIGGGSGAYSGGNGASGTQTHMTNTLNTPVEALEYACPFLVTQYSRRKGSGGDGLYRGGDGLVREIKMLANATATVISERRTIPPYGLNGGESGATGVNTVIMQSKKEVMPSQFSTELNPGDILRIETPGGGGFGRKNQD